jgi:hypothetical protein
MLRIRYRIGNRSCRARFNPLDRLDRLKVSPRIDLDRPDRFRVGKYSKVNRSDRFENEMDPTRVPGSGMKQEINFLPSCNIDSRFNCGYWQLLSTMKQERAIELEIADVSCFPALRSV